MNRKVPRGRITATPTPPGSTDGHRSRWGVRLAAAWNPSAPGCEQANGQRHNVSGFCQVRRQRHSALSGPHRGVPAHFLGVVLLAAAAAMPFLILKLQGPQH